MNLKVLLALMVKMQYTKLFSSALARQLQIVLLRRLGKGANLDAPKDSMKASTSILCNEPTRTYLQGTEFKVLSDPS